MLCEEVCISISSFMDFIDNDFGDVKLKDNPVFTSRDRFRTGNLPYKKTFKSNVNSVIKEIDFDCTDKLNFLYKKINLTQEESNFSYIYHTFNDKILQYNMLYDTIVEKLGYVSYYTYKDKEGNISYMTWYSLTNMLAELLALVTGTNIDVIKFFMTSMNNERGITNDEYSRIYLNSVGIPTGYMLDLLNKLCPTVTNYILNLLEKGEASNYLIRGRTGITDNNFKCDNGFWCYTKNLDYSLTYDDISEIYICSTCRLLCYYLLKYIYEIINDKYNALWTEPGASKRSLSELLVGWSLSELVFQNKKHREFPTFIFKGRYGNEITVRPVTMNQKEVLTGYFNDKIYL